MLKLYLCTYVLLESDESSYYYQEFEDPNYKDFRAEANLQAELRNQAFQKAATAWKGKQSQLASFYAEQVMLEY